MDTLFGYQDVFSVIWIPFLVIRIHFQLFEYTLWLSKYSLWLDMFQMIENFSMLYGTDFGIEVVTCKQPIAKNK